MGSEPKWRTSAGLDAVAAAGAGAPKPENPPKRGTYNKETELVHVRGDVMDGRTSEVFVSETGGVGAPNPLKVGAGVGAA